MRNLNQTITHWTPSGYDAAGDPSGWTRTALLGRWQEQSQLYTRQDGTEAVSRALAYLASDVAIGDFLMLGTSAASDPREITTAWRVEGFRKIANLRDSDYERKAYL